MKKISTATAGKIGKVEGQKLTVGLDPIRTAELRPPSSGDCDNRLAQPSILEMEARSIIRWQHRLKRERPTGTGRTSLTQECGWKDGGRGGPLRQDYGLNENCS